MIRTLQEVEGAGSKVISLLARRNLSDDQKKVLVGMSVALQWMVGKGTTLEMLLAGIPLEPGRTMEDVPPNCRDALGL